MHYNEPHHPLVRSLYRLVGDYGRDGGVRDEVNNFVAQFISIQNLQAPVHQALENLAATAAKYPELEQETVALRADIERRAATEAALRAEVEQRAAAEATLRAEVEQRAAAEATLRNAVDHVKREAADWEARAEAVKADAATMRSELTKANRERNERAAAAEALRNDLSSVRSELAAAQDVGRAAIASLKSETAMASEAPRNVAWLTSVLQLLGLHMRVVADADTLRTDRQIAWHGK